MRHLVLYRVQQNSVATLGKLYELPAASLSGRTGAPVVAVTLELPWRNNGTSVSCIPSGVYTGHRVTHKGYECWELEGVPKRSHILLHVGNTAKDTEGCILIGTTFAADAITESRKAFAAFMASLDGVDRITVTVLDP